MIKLHPALQSKYTVEPNGPIQLPQTNTLIYMYTNTIPIYPHTMNPYR